MVIPVCLLLWWLAAALDQSAVIPSVGEVLDVFLHSFDEPVDLDSASLAAGALVSILRVATGFIIAILAAVPLGMVTGRVRWLRELLQPVISVMMVVSPVAWLPLAIIVFGFASVGSVLYGEESWRADILDQLTFAVVIIIATGAFFPIFINTAAGARDVRNAHVEAVLVLGGGRGDVLKKVILPSALPSIMTGLRVGGGVAWRVMVAAEFFPGTRSGLGHMILTAHSQTEYRYAFAAIIVIAATGLAIDAMLAVAEHRAGRWRRQER
jgi:NitT/TauT family transport system permease protein